MLSCAVFPLEESYELVKNGKNWDAAAVWWPTKEAKKDFYISEPVAETHKVFCYLKSEKFDWKSLKDIKSLSVGITDGYNYGAEFAQLIKIWCDLCSSGTVRRIKLPKAIG